MNCTFHLNCTSLILAKIDIIGWKLPLITEWDKLLGCCTSPYSCDRTWQLRQNFKGSGRDLHLHLHLPVDVVYLYWILQTFDNKTSVFTIYDYTRSMISTTIILCIFVFSFAFINCDFISNSINDHEDVSEVKELLYSVLDKLDDIDVRLRGLETLIKNYEENCIFRHCDLDLWPKVTSFNMVRASVLSNRLAIKNVV